MSKHRTHGAICRLLSGALCLALLLGLLPPGAVLPARAAHWADPYVNTLVDWGVMRGDISGNLAPERSITRAEFVTMMNRAYGYTTLGGHPFTDVRTRDWFNQDIDIAYNIGYFKGTGPTTASPNKTLTREQAAVLLARNMMMQETVGETLGFSDTRTLSEWSRGLVGAATQNGILSGYSDGSFQPKRNITRGEVAAMLVRAIGTPVQTPGDHALGNVYGNVTVNTSGVKLRDGVIAGNLYLTGGIDLGEVLLENVTVLGEIIVSGGGESNSSKSSIIMRNVAADAMTVDSIGSQFVTIRAEGNTDIPTATVRTNAYVDDSSLPGYGLWKIVQDGGSLLQLAGNIKEVVNKTPASSLQVVQGAANKVTVDEKAVGSGVLVDGDARVDDLNLDTATAVTGTGDIKNLNVGAAGSSVEQLPDKIDIRPGIVADINGGTMNSTQASESSTDPKLLAGYPAVRKIAPNSAELVFRANKTGTIYWAISALADGSVSEANLLEPPVYGGNVLQSGTITATAANTDYTAAVSGLTKDGSYYVTAMLVDGREQHSPRKVTSFTTPDDTVPAFAQGYPVMSKVTCDQAQVTVMANKSCQLYYALLPAGSTAPTAAEFKAAAIPGNLGYGSQSVTKNVTTPINVNTVRLDEETGYVLYLWLTDHDGAKSSAVVSLPFTTPDETPPIVTSASQTGRTTDTALNISYTVNEPADLIWAVVTEGNHDSHMFLNYNWTEKPDPANEDITILDFGGDEAALLAAKVKLQSGDGAIASGSATRSPFPITGLPTTTSSFVVYYMANDKATATGNLSKEIKALRVHTMDNVQPTASLSFINPDDTVVTKEPDASAEVRIIFSENVKGGTIRNDKVFLKLYEAMEQADQDRIVAEGSDKTAAENRYETAKNAFLNALKAHITFYTGTPAGLNKEAAVWDGSENKNASGANWVIDWNKVQVEMMDDGSGRLQLIFPGPATVTANGVTTTDYTDSALNLNSGASYYFRLSGIYDLAVVPNPQPLVPSPDPCYLPFETSFAKVDLKRGNTWTITSAVYGDGFKDSDGNSLKGEAITFTDNEKNDPHRIDIDFTAVPRDFKRIDPDMLWDMLLWTDTSMRFTLYSRTIQVDTQGNLIANREGPWELEGTEEVIVTAGNSPVFLSLTRKINNFTGAQPTFDHLTSMVSREYAIHVDEVNGSDDYTAWSQTVNLQVSVVADDQGHLQDLTIYSYKQQYEAALKDNGGTTSSIGNPDPFNYPKTFIPTKAPSFVDGYPSIELTERNGDKTAKIHVQIDADGALAYAVFPLYQLQEAGYATIDPNNTALSEANVNKVQFFGSTITPEKITTATGDTPLAKPRQVPLMSGDRRWGENTGTPSEGTPSESTPPEGTPSAGTSSAGNAVATGDLKNGLQISPPIVQDVFNQRIRNTTASDVLQLTGYNSETIDLTDKLEPNTIYYICFATRGQANNYSTYTTCFRFVTEQAIRPTINVSVQNSSTVLIDVNKTTNLRYFLALNDQEAGFLEKFNGFTKTDWYTADGTGGWKSEGPAGNKQYSNDDYTFTLTLKSNIADMTVVDAMATECYRKTDNINNPEYVGSVFDVFARPEVKPSFYSRINGNASNPISAEAGGSLRCTQGGVNSIDFSRVSPGSYTFISAGTSTEGSGYAFRAFYSVVIRPKSLHPTVTVSPVVTLSTDKKTMSGTAELVFSDPLYFGTESNGRVTTQPLDTCLLETGHTGADANIKAIGTIIPNSNKNTSAALAEGVVMNLEDSHGNAVPAQFLTLTLTGLQVGKSYRLTFTKGLCNSATQGYYDQLPLSISFRVEEPKDATKDPELIITVTPAWDVGT